jgi:hypothetical protein
VGLEIPKEEVSWQLRLDAAVRCAGRVQTRRLTTSVSRFPPIGHRTPATHAFHGQCTNYPNESVDVEHFLRWMNHSHLLERVQSIFRLKGRGCWRRFKEKNEEKDARAFHTEYPVKYESLMYCVDRVKYEITVTLHVNTKE